MYNLDFEEVKVITKLEDYGYDNQYKITDIDEFGNITQYTYNTISGILESIEDPLGNITEYYYVAFDYLQELKQIIDEETKTSVNYTYDKLGRLKTISKNGTTYTFSYNILNEITKIERDLVTILEITYLEENSIPTTYVSSYIYSGTTTISYIYDENKQIIETKYNNTTQYTNKYDLLGNVVETNNINDNYKYYYIYSYDGILQQLIDSNGNSIIYKENGKVIKTFDNEYEINYNHNEEARAMEQTLISAFTLKELNNMRNSIFRKKLSKFIVEFTRVSSIISSAFDD